MKKIAFVLTCFLLVNYGLLNKSFAQIIMGIETPINLSITKEYLTEKLILRPNLYTGIYSNYTFDKYINFSFSGGWSQKQLFYNTTISRYSAIDKIIYQLSYIYPSLDPEIIETLLDSIFNYGNLVINDTVTEKNYGNVTFNYIDLALMYSFKWKNLSFEIGPSISFLLHAKNENTFIQEAPLFEAIPPSNFDTIPSFNLLINSLFPALNSPQTKTSNITSKVPSLDYGFQIGFKYFANNFTAFFVRYTHGFRKELFTNIPKKESLRCIQAGMFFYIEPFKKAFPIL